MMEFTDKHKIINKEQFGFQKKKCTTDAVLDLVETVLVNLDQSKEMLKYSEILKKIMVHIGLAHWKMCSFENNAKL